MQKTKKPCIIIQGFLFVFDTSNERRFIMNDILMQIRSDLPSISKGQKRIANYILES